MTAIFVTAASVYVATQPGNAGTPTESKALTETEVPVATEASNETEAQIGLEALASLVGVGFALVAVLNEVAWIRTHTVARHWKEVADFDVLTGYPGSVDALARLQHHLVNTHLDHFEHNQAIVRRAQRVVGAQAVLTLLFLYAVSYTGTVMWVLR